MPLKKGNKAVSPATTTTTPEPSVVDVQQVAAPTTSSEEGDSEKLKKAVEEILKSLAASEAKYKAQYQGRDAEISPREKFKKTLAGILKEEGQELNDAQLEQYIKKNRKPSENLWQLTDFGQTQPDQKSTEDKTKEAIEKDINELDNIIALSQSKIEAIKKKIAFSEKNIKNLDVYEQWFIEIERHIQSDPKASSSKTDISIKAVKEKTQKNKKDIKRNTETATKSLKKIEESFDIVIKFRNEVSERMLEPSESELKSFADEIHKILDASKESLKSLDAGEALTNGDAIFLVQSQINIQAIYAELLVCLSGQEGQDEVDAFIKRYGNSKLPEEVVESIIKLEKLQDEVEKNHLILKRIQGEILTKLLSQRSDLIAAFTKEIDSILSKTKVLSNTISIYGEQTTRLDRHETKFNEILNHRSTKSSANQNVINGRLKPQIESISSWRSIIKQSMDRSYTQVLKNLKGKYLELEETKKNICNLSTDYFNEGFLDGFKELSANLTLNQDRVNDTLRRTLSFRIQLQSAHAEALMRLTEQQDCINRIRKGLEKCSKLSGDLDNITSTTFKDFEIEVTQNQITLNLIQAEVLAETQVSCLSDVATTTDSGLSTSTTTSNNQPAGAVLHEEEGCSTEEDDDEEYEKGTTTEEDDSEAEDEEVGASSSGDKPDDHPDSGTGRISYGFVNDEPEIFNIVSFYNSTDLSALDDQGANASRQAVQNELNSEASVIAMPKHLNTEDVYKGDYNLGILNLPVLFGSAAAAMASVFFHQEDHSDVHSYNSLGLAGAALVAIEALA